MLRLPPLDVQTSAPTFLPDMRRIKPSGMMTNRTLFSISTRNLMDQVQCTSFGSVSRTLCSCGCTSHSLVTEIEGSRVLQLRYGMLWQYSRLWSYVVATRTHPSNISYNTTFILSKRRAEISVCLELDIHALIQCITCGDLSEIATSVEPMFHHRRSS